MVLPSAGCWVELVIIVLIESASKSLLTAAQVFVLVQNRDLGPDSTRSAEALADESEVDLLLSLRSCGRL